jgi:23S rRNA (adenine2503-C2)-methyltransferase
MAYPGRATVCVSSQAGCGMACPFCATGQAGLTRNLSTAEIVDQVVAAARACANGALDAPGSGAKQQLSNVVFMGMGEPLANYPRVIAALRQLIAKPPAGLGLSRRGITVSTVGLVPGIERLIREDLPVTLAVSLHAPDDALRDTLVPVNTRWPVAEVLAAAGKYAAATGRRVSIEYALIREINDQRERAALLADALREHFDGGRLVHVNLIPLNPTPGSIWTASDPGVQDAFVAVLRGGGIPTTVRDTRGREIDGACGQLAAAP